ncbi:transmembrane protein 135-like isoform X2 [Mytilus californianus]|uniref:transmembrane protein 135-like isoform X2 n=1 Tax=Mytilus californianus TaxID=6549 RepID=UPI002245315D|nr:transmembrane protein 135-like isoform X2 [Mytilus californianus]
MAVLGKPLTSKITCTCYELGHTWTPSCKKASLDVMFEVFKQAVKVYGSLYAIAGVIQRKNKDYFLKSFPAQLARSTIFLTTNGTLFITFFCLWRKVAGSFCYLATFVTGIPACALALCIERKSRRGLLALYMANIATETLYRMVVARGWFKPVPHGEVILFSIASAGYLYLFRKNSLPKSILSTFSKLIGIEELPSTALSEETEKQEPVPVRHNGFQHQIKQNKSIQTVVRWLKDQRKHRLCQHKNSCIYYTLKGLLRNFCIGYGIQGVVKVLGSLTKIVRRPSALLQAIKHKDNFNLGAFLGCFVAIFRAVNCLLRWLRDKDDSLHGMVAGFLAGWSMLWYKSQTIALYAAFKLAEILYFKGISKGLVPYIKCADIIIYSVSTALVFHAAVVEPHNLRPAYWRFLLNVTGNKFAMMNRQILVPYLPNAANIQPDYWPDYDLLHTNLVKPPNASSVIKSVIS